LFLDFKEGRGVLDLGEEEGMDAGVGTSAACEGDRSLEEEAERLFQFLLHGRAVRLNLPTAIIFPVVG
jgi:hypothetical protein